MRRDDALADRVVPARDVRHDRQPQPPRSREERHRAHGLHVREQEARAVAPHRLEQPPGNVAPGAEEPPLHRTLDAGPMRQAAVAIRVEHPVRMARLHPLGVEAVPAVQADRERVVAELPVERGVDAREGTVGKAVPGGEIVSVEHRQAGHSVEPFRRRVARHEEDGGEAPAQALVEPGRRFPCRRRRGSRAGRGGRPRRAWSSSGGRGGSLCPATGGCGDPRRERCAVEAVEAERLVGRPARGPALDAEDGDDAARERGAEARRPGRRPASGPRGRRGARTAQPRPRATLRRSRLSQGIATTRTASAPALPRCSAASERLVEHHGAVREEHRIPAVAQHRAAARLGQIGGSSIRRGEGPIARRSATLPSASSTAQRTSAVVSSHEPGWTIVTSGQRPEERDVAHALVRLPGPGRDQPRVVERVDRPSSPRSPGCRSARSRARRGTRRRSSRRAGTRGGPCPPPSRPCPARRSRTRRTGPGYASSNARMRQSEARSASRTTRSSRSAPSSRSASPYASTTYSSRTFARVPAPDSGSPSRLRRSASGSTGLERGRIEPERREPGSATASSSSATRPRERLVARARPACQRYVPPPSASAAGCSMKDTPFPFTVCATSAFGVVVAVPEALEHGAQRGVVVAVARRRRPSRRRASFASRSPSARISSVGLSDWTSFRSTTTHRFRAARAPPPAAPPSSGPPGARRRRSSRRRGRRGRADASPRRSRAPSRCPSRASPSSPRSRGRRRRGGRRGRRGGGGGGSARAGSRRARRAPRTARGRRGPSRRRRRRGRGPRTRARRRSARSRGGARRRRAS